MHETTSTLPLWSVIPFVGMLLSIAILPLSARHWWEENKNKAVLSFLWALPVLAWFLFKDTQLVFHTLKDYVSFILLLAALFIISGGIVVQGNLRGKPHVNLAILAVGSILANFIGTTGASMLLIRPLIRSNIERRHNIHIKVFFIFLVSNIGGCLTPLGDPPLFLGFLKGVPFFWTLKLFPVWLFMAAALLALFYAVDSFFWRKETVYAAIRDEMHTQPLRILGKRNFIWLAGVLVAVFLKPPVREIVMLLMIAGSVWFTPQSYRKENGFTYYPIQEVAILFAGIFVTMIPALLLLETRGSELGVTQPWQFFLFTGAFSSVLDNAPTYLTFVSLAKGLHLSGPILGIPENLLVAISVGAVFMGANTYIGNAPNFMVKSIAEEAGIKMPSFFQYLLYPVFILFPLYALVVLIFFR